MQDQKIKRRTKSVKEIKNDVCAFVAFASFFFMLGIVGGVENGADTKNLIYAFVSLAVGAAALYEGGYTE